MSRLGLFSPIRELLPAWVPGTAQSCPRTFMGQRRGFSLFIRTPINEDPTHRLTPPSSAPPISFSEVDEPVAPAKHAGCCSSGNQAWVHGGMWPRVLLRDGWAAAGGCRAVLSRFAVRFSPPWSTGSDSPLRSNLHGTATRAFPLIPIVVEQTVRGPDEDMARRLVIGRRARDADLSPLLFPQRVEASALMTYTRGCCGNASCASWAR